MFGSDILHSRKVVAIRRPTGIIWSERSTMLAIFWMKFKMIEPKI